MSNDVRELFHANEACPSDVHRTFSTSTSAHYFNIGRVAVGVGFGFF
jgi:hypothetical protein